MSIVAAVISSVISIGGLIAYMSRRDAKLESGIDGLKDDIQRIENAFARRDVLQEILARIDDRLKHLETGNRSR